MGKFRWVKISRFLQTGFHENINCKKFFWSAWTHFRENMHQREICRYTVAWFAVVFGINSMSKAGSNCMKHSQVQFTVFQVLSIPNTTANHAFTY